MPALLNSTSIGPSSSRGALIELRDRGLVGQVGLQRELAHGVLAQVDADHPRALARE